MKLTKKQLKRIIREEYNKVNQDYILNEGFLDFMKGLGKGGIGGAKKQQAAAQDYKSAWEEQLSKLGEYDEAEVEKVVQHIKNQVRDMRNKLFTSIGNMSALETEMGDVDSGLQAALLAYAWNDLSKGT